MRAGLLSLIVVCTLLPILPGASGQSERDLDSLFLHTGDSNWMDEDAANADDSGGLLLDSTGQIGAEPAGLAFPLTPALDQDLTLASGPVAATIVLGAAYLLGLPSTLPVPVTVTVTLAAGSTTIATGTADGNMPDGTITTATTFTFSMSPSATSIAEAGNLVLTVDISSTVPTGPFFLDTSGASGLVLTFATAPVAGGLSLATGQATAAAAAGATADYGLTVSGPAGSNYTLAASGLPSGFVATFEPAEGQLAASAENVTLSVKSPAGAAPGTHSFNATLSSDGTLAASVALTLTVTDAPTSSSTSATSSSSSGSLSASDSSSESSASSSTGSEPSEKDSPGLGILALLALLAGACLVARRRL